jgi:hypothetical protein
VRRVRIPKETMRNFEAGPDGAEAPICGEIVFMHLTPGRSQGTTEELVACDAVWDTRARRRQEKRRLEWHSK